MENVGLRLTGVASCFGATGSRPGKISRLLRYKATHRLMMSSQRPYCFAKSSNLAPLKWSLNGANLLNLTQHVFPAGLQRGDIYLRTLLIQGARSVIYGSGQKENPTDTQGGLNQLTQRRNKNVAAVTLANKNARLVWAILNHNRDYQNNHKTLRVAA